MAKLENTPGERPSDLVDVGQVSGAYGIRGELRIRPYSAEADVLLNVRNWWIGLPGWHEVAVLQARRHGDEVVARLKDVADRDAAEALRGAVVRVSRDCFPVPEEGEYYWVDLIGLAVFNMRGEWLGTVAGLMDNGVHPVLQVEADVPDGRKKERLIPFVDRYVGKIDREDGKIVVDWELDY